MKIAELISGKDDHEEITIEGVLIPVSVLKKLLKGCTACFTEQALREMA